MPKSEQQEISGMERPKIKAIETAAAKYADVRDQRMKLTEKECAAKLALIETVREHEKELAVDGEGRRVYRYDDQMVIFAHKDTVKVKTAVDDDAGGGDD